MTDSLFTSTLTKNHLRVTTERLQLFDFLITQKYPLPSSEIADLTADKLDKSTVYRNLDLFEKIGVVNRVHSGWKQTVELSEMFKPHHHHMTCTNCGNVISFKESISFTEELQKLEKQNGFISESHSLELKGLCSNCC